MRTVSIPRHTDRDDAIQIAKSLATEEYLRCEPKEIPVLHVIQYRSEFTHPGKLLYCITSKPETLKGERLIGSYSNGKEYKMPEQITKTKLK